MGFGFASNGGKYGFLKNPRLPVGCVATYDISVHAIKHAVYLRIKGGTITIMKPLMLIGIILIVLGVISLTYQGITYTTREKVIDFGPLQATAKTEKTIPLPPVLGVIALIGGIVMVIMGAKKT